MPSGLTHVSHTRPQRFLKLKFNAKKGHSLFGKSQIYFFFFFLIEFFSFWSLSLCNRLNYQWKKKRKISVSQELVRGRKDEQTSVVGLKRQKNIKSFQNNLWSRFRMPFLRLQFVSPPATVLINLFNRDLHTNRVKSSILPLFF